MNAVFHPWPIREFRERSGGIPEFGREDTRFGVQGRFSGAQTVYGILFRATFPSSAPVDFQKLRMQ
jgi:hypothetical protein